MNMTETITQERELWLTFYICAKHVTSNFKKSNKFCMIPTQLRELPCGQTQIVCAQSADNSLVSSPLPATILSQSKDSLVTVWSIFLGPKVNPGQGSDWPIRLQNTPVVA